MNIILIALSNFFTDFLESTLNATDRMETLLTPEACIRKLVELTHEGVKDASAVEMEVQSGLLTTEQRVWTSTRKSVPTCIPVIHLLQHESLSRLNQGKTQ